MEELTDFDIEKVKDCETIDVIKEYYKDFDPKTHGFKIGNRII